MEIHSQLEDVLGTERLLRRSTRAPNLTAENKALHRIVRLLGNSPQLALNEMLKTALNLCDAGSVGISLLENGPEGDVVFRWIAMEGKLSAYVGGSTPRDHSPCGVTLNRNSPQLFLRPDRFFTYFAEAQPLIVEGLVLPFSDGETPWGTIWIVSHDEHTEFDQEDVRIMTSLSGFTTAILRLQGYSAGGKTRYGHQDWQLPLRLADEG